MSRTLRSHVFFAMFIVLVPWSIARAQAVPSGTLVFSAQLTPTAARPEPVRQFTFYILTKSYTDIVNEVVKDDPAPSREKFIDGLAVSLELKDWLKSHQIMDLAMPGVDRIITAEDILHVPEFLLAYQRSNSGGVTRGIPRPKYRETDKTEHPEKYAKQHEDYLNSLRKFIIGHPETVSGIELELDGINPARQWAHVNYERDRHVKMTAPALAQTRFLFAKVDTNLSGQGALSGLPPGNYWLSTLNLVADAGDVHMRWDVPISIQPGQTTSVELTNLNGTDPRSAAIR